MVLLARIVRLVAGIVVLVIVAGLLMHVAGANSRNGIVSTIYDIDKVLVSPFANIFSPKGAKEKIAANWGLAAVVYAILGFLLAALLVRIATGARRGRDALSSRRGTRAT